MSRDLSLHLVTDHRVPFARLREIVDAAVAAGVTVVQLRDKVATGAELFARALDLADVVAGRCAFVIDDRLDVALAARDRGARVDGIHLGQSDLPVDAARALLGTDALIGWTANTPAHLEAAAALPPGTVDYLGVGPVFATATKPDAAPPLGLDGLAAVRTACGLPIVAIGGLSVDNVAGVTAAGADGIAVVSAIMAAADVAEAAARLRARISY